MWTKFYFIKITMKTRWWLANEKKKINISTEKKCANIIE